MGQAEGIPKIPVPRLLLAVEAPHHRYYLRRILEAEGYHIFEAPSVDALMNVLSTKSPNAVLLGDRMPGVSEVELCRRLRAHSPADQLTIVCITETAYTDPSMLKAAGSDWYFPKPVCPHYLTSKLGELLHFEPSLDGVEDPAPLAELAGHLCKLAEHAKLQGVGLEYLGKLVAVAPATCTSPMTRSLELGTAGGAQYAGFRMVYRAEAEDHRPGLQMLCEHAIDLWELQRQRNGLAEDLAASAANLASLFRIQRRQGPIGELEACLNIILQEVRGSSTSQQAAFLITGPETTKVRAFSHAAPQVTDLAQSHIKEVIEFHRPRIFRGSDLQPGAYPQARVLALAPFSTPEGQHGVLALWSPKEEEIGPDLMGRMALLAHQGALSLRFAHLTEGHLRSAKLQQELDLGGQIQEAILQPKTVHRKPGIAVAARAAACHQVAGDFHGTLEMGPTCLDVMVGDVMGKGLPAAVFATTVKSELLRILVESKPDHGFELVPPTRIVRNLSQAMVKDLARFHSFVTLYYGRFDLAKRRFDFVDCGHTNALHYQRGNGKVVEIVHNPEGLTNLPLGVASDGEFQCASVPFEEDDLFLLYSDGVTEASNGEEQFGIDRLREALAQASDQPVEKILDLLQQDLASFQDGTEAGDDMTLLVVRPGSPQEVVHALESTTLPAEHGHLDELRAFVSGALSTCPQLVQDPSRRALILVAAVEVATNIIRHGFADRPPVDYRVTFERASNAVRLRFQDKGCGFDPELAEPAVLGSTKTGGYGLFLIQEIADEVHYSTTSGSNNQLTLTFHLPPIGEPDMQIDTHHIDSSLIITIPTKTLDCDNSEEFRKDIEDSVQGCPQVVLDLSALEFIDSSGLGAILSSLRDVTAAGGDLKLCGLSEAVRAVFDLVRMHRVFDIHDLPEQASAAFSQ